MSAMHNAGVIKIDISPDFISERCYKASQSVIYGNEYSKEEQALQKCIDRLRAIGHEEYELLDNALEHKDAIRFMFEHASYLQGMLDTLRLIAGMQID